MKKLILLAFVALFSVGVMAQNSGLGLGVIFGEPTGLSAKIWTSERTALDGTARPGSLAGARHPIQP